MPKTIPIEELERLKIKWYHNKVIAFEIIKAIKYRETVFLDVNRPNTNRNLKINAIRYLYKNFDRFKFFDDNNLYNIYNSVARYPNMPMFSFKTDDKREQRAEFNRDFKKYIEGYDFVIDIDNPDLNKAYDSTNKIKKLFDGYEIPYSLKFSGKKGFHFTVPFGYLPDKIEALGWGRMKDLFKMFAYELKTYNKIRDIDLNVYDLRRIWKTPYSIVYPFYYVALPLTDDQFENFTLNQVFLPEVIEDMDSFRDRGLCMRLGKTDNLIQLIIDIANKQKGKSELFGKMKSEKTYLYNMIGGIQ